MEQPDGAIGIFLEVERLVSPFLKTACKSIEGALVTKDLTQLTADCSEVLFLSSFAEEKHLVEYRWRGLLGHRLVLQDVCVDLPGGVKLECCLITAYEALVQLIHELRDLS